ncbi:MAG: DMT family transporter [Lachnospiraceae bacterium]|nr:DMT family transporter [Lachnospiraceae bacterium]
MKKKETISLLLLFLAAIIWGVSFVAQSEGGKTLGPYSFNGIRLLLGSLVLFIAIKITDKAGFSKKPVTKEEKKSQFIIGLVCGLFLFFATNTQQIGINLCNSTGKAGFLTAVYILLVPIIALIVFKKKCSWNVWVGVVIALGGLYFLCIKDEFVFALEDILLLLAALGFAGQIITIDVYGGKVDSLRLSELEFFTAGVLTVIIALFKEIIPFAGGFSAWLKIWTSGGIWVEMLYMAVLSCGVAYTLQVFCQKNLDPTIASLAMSFEAVFAAIAGWLILNQKMDVRELMGCVLMFIAIIVAQLNFKKKQNNLI